MNYGGCYILGLLFETGMTGCKPLGVPMAQNLKLLAYNEKKNRAKDLLKEARKYRRLVGKLIYLTITQPDISYSVQTLSQFMQMPTKAHMATARNVLRYLKAIPGLGVFKNSKGKPKLGCYCDSDWASYPMTRRSVSGYLLKLGGSLVMWKTKKQHTVSKSSAEAEYKALSMAISEVVWAVSLLKDVGIDHKNPVKVYL
ncbi:uncharacterized protein LOC114740432 [Neltuma alba]|uniref:uncharacterized protein LOC114740432 n=1 Tax=Neltuma alba TaxID=207710 RepID=UPI0010A42A7D|nr:uncharacterized protein LOC114740432 [Prosopis alba]